MEYLLKTDKAVAELRSRQRTLGLKERALLLLADGKKTGPELASLVQAEATLIHALLNQGYLAPVQIPAPQTPASAKGKTQPVPAATASTPSVPSPAGEKPPAHPAQPVRGAADTFDGKRSLVTARMFLFDVAERMFARRDPALVEAMREQFRGAHDRESLQSVARELLQRIETEAGSTRADDISARLAMLLPDDIAA